MDNVAVRLIAQEAPSPNMPVTNELLYAVPFLLVLLAVFVLGVVLIRMYTRRPKPPPPEG